MYIILTQLFGHILPEKIFREEKSYMIVSNYFEYDSTKIGWVQHDVYGYVIFDLFDIAKRIYHDGECVVGITTQLTRDSRDTRRFAHRTLQYFHDTIAAQFRYEYIFHKCEGPLFHTFDNSSEEKEIVLLLWKEYYPKELERLAERYPSITRLILTSATYPDPDRRGIEAVEDILIRLRNEYQFKL
jgi:hypothetical protein